MAGKTTPYDQASMEFKRLHEAQSDVADSIRINTRSLEDSEAKASIRNLAEWLTSSTEPDLMENRP